MSAVKTKGLSVLRRIGGFWVAAPGENDAGKSRFERWWRPLFGYAVSLTWVLHMLTLCRVVWEDNPPRPRNYYGLSRNHVSVECGARCAGYFGCQRNAEKTPPPVV